MTSPHTTLVWDPLVRVFHWLLAAAFFTAYLTAEESEQVHTLSGYIIAAIIVGRLLWGFVGTPHARFKDFVKSPVTVIEYLKAMSKRQHPRYIGHNPAGGMMVLLLLGSLAATTFTGMVNLGIEEQAGPLAGWTQSMNWHDDDFIEEIHEFFANFTLLLVLFHVSGVIVESLLHKDNLVKAMITGQKKEPLTTTKGEQHYE